MIIRSRGRGSRAANGHRSWRKSSLTKMTSDENIRSWPSAQHLASVLPCPLPDGLSLSNHLDDNTLLLLASTHTLLGTGIYPNTQTTTSSRLYRIPVSSSPPIVCTLVLILFCRATLESPSSSNVLQSILDVTKRKLRSRYRSSISLFTNAWCW